MKNSLLKKKPIEQVISEVRADASHSLKRDLSVKDLTAFGIAAIIGAGIFSSFGAAAAEGGPAISLLFVFTAIACGFSAICYAEFANRVPISGSAYTYAYVTFGELVAWIIGWDLILEYAVGNIFVAISWSQYFTQFIRGIGIAFPHYMSIDYYSASHAFRDAAEMISQGISPESLPFRIKQGYMAWTTAPSAGGIRLIADIPAMMITVLITYIVYIGIKESKRINNVLVAIKLIVVFGVIAGGAFYVNTDNWTPFAPRGIPGVLKGVAAVFFAYIGFDAISTTAEECKNPSRDLPRSIIYTLIICTVLYVLITLVLTGMVNYTELDVGDPLAYVFTRHGLEEISGIISFTAIVAMAGVLLVFQLGQPRILMSMSRDGLLPKVFARIHPRFKTPSFSTIVTGFFVAIPAMFLNLNVVLDLTSIGTLFAFVIVCGGVLLLKDEETSGFKVPYINGRYILSLITLAIIVTSYVYNKENFLEFFNLRGENGMQWEKTPRLFFAAVTLVFCVFTYLKKWSLIPVLGLLTCLFLMSELGATNWLRFIVWLLAGFIIYFGYSRKNSRIHNNQVTGSAGS